MRGGQGGREGGREVRASAGGGAAELRPAMAAAGIAAARMHLPARRRSFLRLPPNPCSSDDDEEEAMEEDF